MKAWHIKIPLKQTFKHASANHMSSDSIIVEIVRNNISGLGEGCPRPFISGETPETALKWISEHRAEMETITDFEKLKTWTGENSPIIDKNPAAWCAVELALLDLFAKERKCPVETLLYGPISSEIFQYTAVLGDNPGPLFRKTLFKYLIAKFSDFKIKINGTFSDSKKIDELKRLSRFMGRHLPRLRLDANNVWKNNLDKACEHLAGIDYPLFAVEEPLSPRDHQHIEISKHFRNIREPG
jgi:L-alanine-DL-glutamate epimerase-like enolase superfamily enzyme